MKRLGVTGGIGSGKSYVCRILQERFGIPVYNCDIRARIITWTDPDVITRLSALDAGLYSPSGELDKVRMAQYMFASEEHLQTVNSIIHPAVRNDLRQWYARHAEKPIVAMESAILYESGFQSEVDCVLFVDAPLELRVRRAVERDAASEQQIRQRVNHQQTDEAHRLADFVINNDGAMPLEPQLREVLDTLDTLDTLDLLESL